MSPIRRFVATMGLVAWLATFAVSARAADPGREVVRLTLDGVVDPFVASSIGDGIAAANRDGAAGVLITIDTPGGLDSSMRSIIRSILASKIPVVCYTGPSGARAASAGTFIMMGCPVAAMAPGTNIGAAHPVGVSGVVEEAKVTNDAAAFIRSLAERWGRDADWAERAVRDSVSLPADDALRERVVDVIAPSVPALLDRVGCVPPAGTAPAVPPTGLLHERGGALPGFCGVAVVDRGLGLGAGILHGLIDPNLAFLFFYGGLALVIVELLHPGISIPGILGTLMLVLAFISFGLLPVQIAGVALLLASAVFFLIELKHPGIGLPTLGGLVTLVIGGLVLFNPAVPNARVSPWVVATVAAALALFFGSVVRAVLATRHLPPSAGPEELAGEEGVALTDLRPNGQVRARRETWSAQAEAEDIAAGSVVRVVRMEGLRLVVAPVRASLDEGHPPGREAAGRKGGAT